MEKKDVNCRIWAIEISHDGSQHRSHARFAELDGNTYSREMITQTLETKQTLDKNGKWVLLACEPSNHTEIIECKKCQYTNQKGLSKYYDIREQVKGLQAVRPKDYDIREIVKGLQAVRPKDYEIREIVKGLQAVRPKDYEIREIVKGLQAVR